MQFMRPVEGAGSTGTCLPVAKGGTGCDAAATVNYLKNELVNTLYPVGTIMTTTTSANPGATLGGTWVQYGQGRTLLGVGSNEANTDNTFGTAAAGGVNRTTVEERGGAYAHTLTVAQMPSHSHNPPIAVTYNGNAATQRALFATNSPFWVAPPSGDSNNAVSPTGGGGSHNNVQPYVTVYFWKRTN